MTTQEVIDQIRELEKQATLGPWTARAGGLYTSTEGWGIARPYLSDRGNEMEDLAFIAASRQAVPVLLAEIDKLRGILCEISEPDSWEAEDDRMKYVTVQMEKGAWLELKEMRGEK